MKMEIFTAAITAAAAAATAKLSFLPSAKRQRRRWRRLSRKFCRMQSVCSRAVFKNLWELGPTVFRLLMFFPCFFFLFFIFFVQSLFVRKSEKTRLSAKSTLSQCNKGREGRWGYKLNQLVDDSETHLRKCTTICIRPITNSRAE